MQKQERKRIDLLDGFRFIAISLVICYHYLSHFSTIPNLYPYGNKYSDLIIPKYGFLGVEFFFIISGFVIALTLEKSSSLKEFLIKRFIRLFPTILVCSVLTFTMVRLFDSDNNFPIFHRSLLSFIPSLTFTDLAAWSRILGEKDLGYIDGVYWSLAVEVKFYIVAGVIFFYKRTHFFENWMKWTLFIFIIYYALLTYTSFSSNNYLLILKSTIEHLLFTKYMVYFTLGILFYRIFSKRELKPIYLFLITIYALIEAIVFLPNNTERIFGVIFLTLFVIFLFRPQTLRPLSIPIIAKIGVASYPLYLIHQFVGLLLINKISFLISDKSGIISIILVSISMILFSFLIHYYIEIPFNKFIKPILLPKQKSRKDTEITPVQIYPQHNG